MNLKEIAEQVERIQIRDELEDPPVMAIVPMEEVD